MNARTRQVIIFVLGMIAGIFLVAQFAFRDNDTKENKKAVAAAANVYRAPKLPSQMTLFGEKVPLERQDIREAFDRELIYNSYSQGHMIYIMKLADRYFPQIEATLKAHGIPDDFKYLCVAESNLQNLVSRVGASGFWQFMKGTAPGYNLQVNENVDERYHVQKSTEAACKYLKQAYAKFGNWTAAAASYNCGMGGYNNAATYQKTRNYYDLLLPEETNKYIFRILAFKHILSNAEQMGFQLSKDDLYGDYPTKSVTVNSSINDLVGWAISRGTTYKMVKKLNPWIRGRTLSVKPGQSYQVKLPA
jgi:membrane-bound lytic murein transglycosylase D